MGIWDWTSAKISSITTKLNHAYEQVSLNVRIAYQTFTSWSVLQNISELVRTITSIPALRNAAHNAGLQVWEGATRPLDPHNLTRIMSSPTTKEAMKESFKANVIYSLSLAVVLARMHDAINSFSDEDDYTLTSSFYWMVSTVYFLVLSSLLLHRLFDNSLINTVVSRRIVKENPTSHIYQPCVCSAGATTSAGLFSSINLLSRVVGLWAVSYNPVLKYVVPFASAYTYGESLAEVPYSSVGMCTTHRAEAFSKHKSYSFGVGTILSLFEWGISYGINYLTGANGFFISFAVSSAITPYFIASMQLRDRPLPGGDEPGIDIYYYHREAVEKITRDGGRWLIDKIRHPPAWTRTVAAALPKPSLQQVEASTPLRWSKNLVSHDFFYGDWSTVSGFVTNPAVTLFFDEYYADVMGILESQIRMREPLMVRILYGDLTEILAPVLASMPKVIVGFLLSPTYYDLLKILFNPGLTDPLTYTHDHLQAFRKMQIDLRETPVAISYCTPEEREQRLREALNGEDRQPCPNTDTPPDPLPPLRKTVQHLPVAPLGERSVVIEEYNPIRVEYVSENPVTDSSATAQSNAVSDSDPVPEAMFDNVLVEQLAVDVVNGAAVSESVAASDDSAEPVSEEKANAVPAAIKETSVVLLCAPVIPCVSTSPTSLFSPQPPPRMQLQIVENYGDQPEPSTPESKMEVKPLPDGMTASQWYAARMTSQTAQQPGRR